MAIRGKNNWTLFLFILAGIVLGGFLLEWLCSYDFGRWLAYGKSFGVDTMTLNLGILQLTFGLQIKINIASILGIFIAVLVHRKM